MFYLNHKTTYFFFLIGCDSDRRKNVVDFLNSEYEELLQKKLSIYVAYSDMVAKHSYRVLASYSYDAYEKPLRSERIVDGGLPQRQQPSSMGSVGEARSVVLPSRFLDVSNIPGHQDFVQLVINAKVLATIEGSSTSINWRGYSSTIFPELEMTTKNLRHELLNALQCISELSDVEKKVI